MTEFLQTNSSLSQLKNSEWLCQIQPNQRPLHQISNHNQKIQAIKNSSNSINSKYLEHLNLDNWNKVSGCSLKWNREISTELNGKEKQGDDIVRKYNQFMNNQNSIITKILTIPTHCPSSPLSANSNNGSTIGNDKQSLIQSLTSSSNSFIKQLLTELSQIYSKHHALRITANQKIDVLSIELENQRNVNKLLKQQLYQDWQQKYLQCQKYITWMQTQLKSTQTKYQQKISALLQQHESMLKQQQTQKKSIQQLTASLARTQNLLRHQQQNLNHKIVESKGNQMLILEYQSTIFANQGKIGNLEGMLGKLREENTGLQAEIDRLKATVQKLEESKIHTEEKLTNMENDRDTQIKTLKQKLTSTQTQYSTQTKTLQTLQTQLSTLQSILIHQPSVGPQQLIPNSVKESIQRMQKKYQKREKLLKRGFLRKIGDLRSGNQELRRFVQAQIRTFRQNIVGLMGGIGNRQVGKGDCL